MALPPHPHVTSGSVEFLAGNTLTPIPARNILNFKELKKVAEDFVSTGQRSRCVFWEPV